MSSTYTPSFSGDPFLLRRPPSFYGGPLILRRPSVFLHGCSSSLKGCVVGFYLVFFWGVSFGGGGWSEGVGGASVWRRWLCEMRWMNHWTTLPHRGVGVA
ncbi:hypothetical protein HanIR_Chr14g0691861 [Helianthus annuus]|nr:hypothetical protein HanIR_Chr14g0691861 [Helianthus annuus]